MTLRGRYSRARGTRIDLARCRQGLEPDMPENRLMYLGIVLIVAAAALWIGAELTRRVEWMVPYIGIGGIVLVVLGVVLEFTRARRQWS